MSLEGNNNNNSSSPCEIKVSDSLEEEGEKQTWPDEEESEVRVLPTIGELSGTSKSGVPSNRITERKGSDKRSTTASQFLSVPTQRHRKFSLPIISWPTSDADSTVSASDLIGSGRRRLSQVGLAVSQHLPTIRWKPVHNEEEIRVQAKCLCAKYLRFKLRRCGFSQKQLRLQRLSSVTNMTQAENNDASLNRVAYELKYIIHQLERAAPKLYFSVTSNIGHPASIFTSPSAIVKTHQMLGQEIFRNDISWAKIASYYASTGALAADCIRCGHPDYVLSLVDSLVDFVGQELSAWISQQGGWESLVDTFRCEDEWKKTLKLTLITMSFLIAAILLYCIF